MRSRVCFVGAKAEFVSKGPDEEALTAKPASEAASSPAHLKTESTFKGPVKEAPRGKASL